MKTKKSSNLFFSGVVILTISNLLIKLVGLTLKIPLSHFLGDDGMAYYNLAYEIYVWFYMISTAGLPVAISMLISESRAKGNFREAKKIFNVTLVLFIIIGLAGMSVMIFGSGFFGRAYSFTDADIPIIAIAPTLFLICVSSAIRGYFQGYQEMVPTAVSQCIEAVGKLTVGIALAVYALKKGYSMPVVAAYTVTGLTVGVGLGMIYLCISKALFNTAVYDEQYRLENSESMAVRTTSELVKVIIITAIPITLSSSVMSLTSMLDSMILSNRLQATGYTEELTRTMYGNYKTLAVSMFNVPPALIYPVSYSVIPLMSAAVAQHDKVQVRIITRSVLKLASLIEMPCAFGMSFLAEPLLKLLFAADSAERAAPLLSVLSFSVIMVGYVSVTNAILQSHKLERLPIISMVAGAVVKLIASYVLIGIPAINIYGSPISTFLSYLTVVLFNLWFIKKKINIVPEWGKFFFRPLIASFVCGCAGWGAHRLLSDFMGQKTATVCAVLCAAAVYLVSVVIFRCITREDIMLLPKGQKILSVADRLKIKL